MTKFTTIGLASLLSCAGVGAAGLLCTDGSTQQQQTSQARELGAVRWERSLEKALAGQPEKPILALFQEVPG